MIFEAHIASKAHLNVIRWPVWDISPQEMNTRPLSVVKNPNSREKEAFFFFESMRADKAD
jgi:DNA primase